MTPYMQLRRVRRAWHAALIALLPGTAAASHSPSKPVPQAVFAMPGDTTHVVIATRFGGAYVTVDGGATFMNACHEALGADDVESYPGAFTASGTVALSTGFRGVSTTREGCEWNQWAPDRYGIVTDVATFGDDGLLALKGEPELPSQNEVWTSTDAGTTWTQAEGALPSGVLASSVRATSDGTKWFVGVRATTGAQLLRSEDAGRTWTSFELPSSANRTVRLVGVTPAPLERLVAILSEDHADGAQPMHGDVVILSEDAGQTWSTLHQSEHALPGAALNEDGVLFFGSPEDGLHRLDLRDVGDVRPVLASRTPTRGLAAAGGRVYSIGDENSDGYTVAISADAGATFRPFFAICSNAITQACTAQSSVGMSCSSFAIETQPWQPLGAACTQPATSGAGGAGAVAGTSSTATAATSDAPMPKASGASQGAGGFPAASDPAARVASGSRMSCSSATPAARRSTAGLLALCAAALALVRRRR